MGFTFTRRSAFYIGLVFLIWSSFIYTSKAAHSDFSNTLQNSGPDLVGTSYTDSLHLTQDKVKDWIKTRISIAKLQKQMKANAGDYDDVVQAFYIKRESLLKSRG